jgi:Protein of unknown function (DUF1553)/Protein of unknown function (DUF1549)/Planctomycete cytochrome C
MILTQQSSSRPLFVSTFILGTWAMCIGPASAQAPIALEYNRDIRPILSENCFPCHGPDKAARKADLRLDLREAAVAAEAIVPGQPEKSGIIERIFAEAADRRMPPAKSHKSLTVLQKEAMRRWIAAGAVYQPHWAYIAPKRSAVPDVPDKAQVRNPIDSFIQAQLAGKGAKPSAQADANTLRRRLSLDLIGLPPQGDAADLSYEKLVDRLLESPQFGERMAQPWLDLARYADTVGYHGDQNQNAWAYRDYVIDSFNKNKPFDQFTVEQLAGDLLPNPTPEQRTATCFLRLNMMTREGGAQPKEYLAKYTADRIRTVATTWLGSTFGCCECHDHKFDPIKTRDFYSLGAFFADIKQWGVYQTYDYTPNPELAGWSNDHPWPPEIVVDSPALQRQLKQLHAQVETLAQESSKKDSTWSEWKKEIGAFLDKHPNGWETPAPVVAVDSPTQRPRTPAAGRNAQAGEKAATTPSALPSAQIGGDGKIVFPDTRAATANIDLRPSPGWLAAVRIELLAAARFQDKIVRDGQSTMARIGITLQHANGKIETLRARVAIADHYAPRYANGFEIIGVQNGWRTDPKHVHETHTAVFFLDQPARLADGDVVRIRLMDNLLAGMRVSTSPLAPRDVQHPQILQDLKNGLNLTHSDHLRSTGFEPDAFAKLKALEVEILQSHEGTTPVMVVEHVAKPMTIRVLARGNWMDESGDICQPDTPSFLWRPANLEKRTLTRLDLARWLCAPENPLTARVFVNRVWKELFGVGLCARVDDMGAQGDPPSHPELLDWLAVEFRESGWNVKHLVKLMVLSHTYRQSSRARLELLEIDPNNRLLAAQNPRRLEAEIIRDNALAIAGLLNLEPGGPPAKPFQPPHYYDALQFPDRDYVPDRDQRAYRRSVYMHWQRTFVHPMLANFDAPSREDCIAMRSAANSPQQALTLLNDPEFVEAARVWASMLLDGSGQSNEQRLERAFAGALARKPTEKERSGLLRFLDQVRAEYRQRPEDAKKLLRTGPAPGPTGDPIELAAWTSLCRVILNLHETITKY